MAYLCESVHTKAHIGEPGKGLCGAIEGRRASEESMVFALEQGMRKGMAAVKVNKDGFLKFHFNIIEDSASEKRNRTLAPAMSPVNGDDITKVS